MVDTLPHPFISAVIISCDEADVIEPCLQSVAPWVDEIVVIDMHSTDGTRAIASRYTDRVLDHERLSYADPARAFALEQARGEWIVMLDPDERVPAALAGELRHVAESGDVDVVRIQRQSISFGKAVKSPGSADTPQARFFRRGVINWPREVHGTPDLTTLRQRTLPAETHELYLLHAAWRSVPAVLDKIVRYAPKDVENLQARGQTFSLKTLFSAPTGQFVRRMGDGRAYEDGMAGLLMALYWAVYYLTIFAELWEAEGRPSRYDRQIERWGRRMGRIYRLARAAVIMGRRIRRWRLTNDVEA